MTDQEKAVIMAYTGYCMLSGEKFNIFHKYVEKIMERPIWTHELPMLQSEIHEASKKDFLSICANTFEGGVNDD